MMKDTQDALNGREQEKALKQELARVANELEKERLRAKQASDKVRRGKFTIALLLEFLHRMFSDCEGVQAGNGLGAQGFNSEEPHS